MKFNKMEFDARIVRQFTNKAYLLKAPSGSEYEGYVFWWPSRWIRKSEKPSCRILMFQDSDQFDFFSSMSTRPKSLLLSIKSSFLLMSSKNYSKNI